MIFFPLETFDSYF